MSKEKIYDLTMCITLTISHSQLVFSFICRSQQINNLITSCLCPQMNDACQVACFEILVTSLIPQNASISVWVLDITASLSILSMKGMESVSLIQLLRVMLLWLKITNVYITTDFKSTSTSARCYCGPYFFVPRAPSIAMMTFYPHLYTIIVFRILEYSNCFSRIQEQ